jgi:secondary thiamine-phosphate synthase enzyme
MIRSILLRPVETSAMKDSINGNFRLKTRSRSEMVNITDEVSAAVRAMGLDDGWITVFIPHTTCGVTINENADPDVVRDLLATLETLVPRDGDYRHAEGNSDAHVKASLMGASVRVPVEKGKLLLGTWQGIFLCEFDGPRTREVWVRPG